MKRWPKCDVEVRIELDPALVGWPEGGITWHGANVNREFEDLRTASWRAAQDVLTEEHDIARLVSRQVAEGRRFDDAFSEGEEEFALSDLTALDLGVAGAVLALNAAGCPTIYSCNGHQVGYPYIAFCARRSRLRSLIDSAQTAGVGLINGIDGGLEAFADRRDGLIRFGMELVKRAEQFSKAQRVRRSGGRRRQMSLPI